MARKAIPKTSRPSSARASKGPSPQPGAATGGRLRSRRWIVFASLALLALAGVAIPWERVLHALDRHDVESAGDGSKAEAANDIKSEFLRAAQVLFTTAGGQMDRTRSDILRRTIAQVGTEWSKVIAARFELVHTLLREAKNDEAIQEAETLLAELARRPTVLQNEPNFHRIRALAYLRKSEIENCLNRHNRECCVFPLAGGGVHTDKSPAAEAARSYLAFLAARPNDLGARWLLNITHMAMGTYPESVPKQFLIPQKGPGSVDNFPRFNNIARECGITRMNHAGGSIVDDIDGDGLLDIVLSSCCPDVSLAYYHNKGDGMFEDRAAAAGLGDQLGGLNLVSTDYDNDGDIDLFVLRGGWLYDQGCIRNSLLRNNGDGTFTDVTRAAGLAEPACPTQVGVWFDFDNDGDLDVFVGNESRMDRALFPPEPNNHGNYPCNLFRNNGNGTFTDVAAAAGVTNDRFCKGASAGDYDNDGWMDLYVSNIGRNRLYRNKGDGTFVDVAEELGLMEPVLRSFATWFFDHDNDGNLDIYVGAYDQFLDDTAAWQLGLPFKSAPPRLYRNQGNGAFVDVTREAGLWRPIQPMGANFGDLDNDGWLDLYLTTGNPDYEALVPDVMLRSVEGARFEDVTVAGGFGNLQKGHGAAFADLDHDGDQDIVHQVGGFFAGDVFFNSLFENPGSPHHFLALKLVGRRSNRLAYGARIHVVVRTPRGPRSLHRAVGSVSSFGGSPARQEIGLGDAEAVESVEIWWPASGTRQRLSGLALDSFYEITEGDDAPKKLNPLRYTLGGGH